MISIQVIYSDDNKGGVLNLLSVSSQANEQFRKHLKARGLEDLADEIENPQ